MVEMGSTNQWINRRPTWCECNPNIIITVLLRGGIRVIRITASTPYSSINTSPLLLTL